MRLTSAFFVVSTVIFIFMVNLFLQGARSPTAGQAPAANLIAQPIEVTMLGIIIVLLPALVAFFIQQWAYMLDSVVMAAKTGAPAQTAVSSATKQHVHFTPNQVGSGPDSEHRASVAAQAHCNSTASPFSSDVCCSACKASWPSCSSQTTWLRSPDGQAAAISLSRCCLRLTWPCLFDADPSHGVMIGCCPCLLSACGWPGCATRGGHLNTTANRRAAGGKTKKGDDLSSTSNYESLAGGSMRVKEIIRQSSSGLVSGSVAVAASSDSPSHSTKTTEYSSQSERPCHAMRLDSLLTVGSSLVDGRFSRASVYPAAVPGPRSGSSGSARPARPSRAGGGVQRQERRARILAASIAGLQHTSTVAVPVVSAVLAYTYAVCLDLFLGPGRGTIVALATAIMWPILAAVDFDRAIVPWISMQAGYIVWSVCLFTIVSIAGDAWPIGRMDLDRFPYEFRYDFFSPLGLNGLGALIDLVCYSSFIMVAYPSVMGLDQAFVKWRVSEARVKLRDLQAQSIRQQQVIIDSVVDQVPPFAQECMEAGVMAFEARPVVMAVQTVYSRNTSRSRGMRVEVTSSADMPAGGAVKSTGIERVQELCACMDYVYEGSPPVVSPSQQASILDPIWKYSQPAAYGNNTFHAVSRGLLHSICLAYEQASTADTEVSVAAASLGVISGQQRVRIANLCQLGWASIGNSTRIDTICVDGMEGTWLAPDQQDSANSQSQWICAAGLRTPCRTREPMDYRTGRVATCLSFLAAVLRFAYASTRASSRGTYLRAGIAYPSSSQSAMVVGLLGLKQQPQEWASVGGGRAEASRLAAFAASKSWSSANLTADTDRTHVLCASRSTVQKVSRVLEELSKAIEAVVQWQLAVAAAASRDNTPSSYRFRGGVANKAGQDSHVSLLDAYRLRQSLARILQWIRSVSSRASSAKDTSPSSNAEVACFSMALPAPGQNQHADGTSPVDKLRGLQAALSTVCGAVLPSHGNPSADKIWNPRQKHGTAELGKPPRWLQSIISQGPTDLPSNADTASSRHYPVFRMLETCSYILDDFYGRELGPVTYVLLPDVGVLLKEMDAPDVQLHDTIGLPLRSGFVMAAVGLSLAFSSVGGPVQMASIEVTAGLHEWSDIGAVLSHGISFTPRLIAGIAMAAVGWQAHSQGRLLDPTRSLLIYLLAICSVAIFHVLFLLEISTKSCFSRTMDVQNSSPVLAAVIFTIGAVRLYGSSIYTASLAFGVSLLVSSGLFRISQALLEGTLVRSYGEAARVCSLVFANTPVKAGSDRLDFELFATTFAGSVYTMHFVLTYVNRSSAVLRTLHRVQQLSMQAARVAEAARMRLQEAASTLIPLKLIEKYAALGRQRDYCGYDGLDNHKLYTASLDPLRGIRVVTASLGQCVVATVYLKGYLTIADIAGPVAAFGLRRRIGAEVDTICSRYGAVRMQAPLGFVRVAWIRSQVAGRNFNGCKDPVSAVVETSQYSGGSKKYGLRQTTRLCNWRAAAVAGSAELFLRIKVELKRMNYSLVPLLGIASGEVEAAVVGALPATVLYTDEDPAQDRRPILQSSLLAWRLGERAPEYPGTVSKAAEVAVSPVLTHEVTSKFSELGLLFVFAAQPAGEHTGAKSHGLLWAEYLHWFVGVPAISTPLPGAIKSSWLAELRGSERYFIHLSSAGEAISAQGASQDSGGIEWKQRWLQDLRCKLLQSSPPSQDGPEPSGASQATNACISTYMLAWISSWARFAIAAQRVQPSRPQPEQLLIPDRSFSDHASGFTAVASLGSGEFQSSEIVAARIPHASKLSVHILVINESNADEHVVAISAPGLQPAEASSNSRSSTGNAMPIDLPSLPRFRMHEFKRLKVLGEGGFARVYHAVHLSTGKQYALKITQKLRGRAQGSQCSDHHSFSAGYSGQHAYMNADVVRSEILAMLRCAGHGVPGACRLEGVVIGDGEVGIVMELVDGKDLAALVHSRPGRWRMQEGAVRVIARQLSCSLAGMHRAGVLHRDIKPSNIVLEHGIRARLLDYGLTRTMQRSSAQPPSGLEGAKLYMPMLQQSRVDSRTHHVRLANNPQGSRKGQLWKRIRIDLHDDLHLVLPLLHAPDNLKGDGAQVIVRHATVLIVNLTGCETSELADQMNASASVQQLYLAITAVASVDALNVLLEKDSMLFDIVFVMECLNSGKQRPTSTKASRATEGAPRSKKLEVIEAVRTSCEMAARRLVDSSGATSRLESGLSEDIDAIALAAAAVTSPAHSTHCEDGFKWYSLVPKLFVAEQGSDEWSLSSHSGYAGSDIDDPHDILSGAATSPDLKHAWSSVWSSARTRAESVLREARARSLITDPRRGGRASLAVPSNYLLGCEEALLHRAVGLSKVVLPSSSNKVTGTATRPYAAMHISSVPVPVSATMPTSQAASGYSTSTSSRTSQSRLEAEKTKRSVADPCGSIDEDSSGYEVHRVQIVSADSSGTVDLAADAIRRHGLHRDSKSLEQRTSGGNVLAKKVSSLTKHDGAAMASWVRTVSSRKTRDSAAHRESDASAQYTTRSARQGRMYRENQPFVAGIAGTPLFMAPELFKHQGQRASDYWSLGVTLFWLLAGRMPFEGDSEAGYLAAARRGRVSWHLLPASLSPECLDLLRGLLEVSVEYRYDAGVLAVHPWLFPPSQSGVEALDCVLHRYRSSTSHGADPTASALRSFTESQVRTEGLVQPTSQQLPAGTRWLYLVQRPEFTKRRWATDDPFSGAAADVAMHSDSYEHIAHDLGRFDGIECDYNGTVSPGGQNDEDASLEVSRKVPLYPLPGASQQASQADYEGRSTSSSSRLTSSGPTWVDTRLDLHLERCGPVNGHIEGEYLGDEQPTIGATSAGAYRRAEMPKPRSTGRIRALLRKRITIKRVRAMLELFARRFRVKFRLLQSTLGRASLEALQRYSVRQAAFRDLRVAGVSEGASSKALTKFEAKAMARSSSEAREHAHSAAASGRSIRRGRNVSQAGGAKDAADGTQFSSHCSLGIGSGGVGFTGDIYQAGALDAASGATPSKLSPADETREPTKASSHRVSAAAFGLARVSLPSVIESDGEGDESMSFGTDTIA